MPKSLKKKVQLKRNHTTFSLKINICLLSVSTNHGLTDTI